MSQGYKFYALFVVTCPSRPVKGSAILRRSTFSTYFHTLHVLLNQSLKLCFQILLQEICIKSMHYLQQGKIYTRISLPSRELTYPWGKGKSFLNFQQIQQILSGGFGQRQSSGSSWTSRPQRRLFGKKAPYTVYPAPFPNISQKKHLDAS